MRIKICGITRAEDARFAVSCGADSLGFVLAPGKRALTLGRALELAREAAGEVPECHLEALPPDLRHGVEDPLEPRIHAGPRGPQSPGGGPGTKPPNAAPPLQARSWRPLGVARVAVMVDPSEDEARRAAEGGGFTHLQLHGRESAVFCRRLGIPIVKAFRLLGPDDVERLDEFMQAMPGAMPLVDGPAGGSGQRASWELAAQLAARYRIVLAGGLTPGNVALAIATVRPLAVDVSSGVEAAPGRKDLALVEAFVRAARTAFEALDSRG